MQRVLPYNVLGLWFTTFGAVFFVNSLRTLAAHRYRYPGSKTLDLSEQFLDSVNTPNSFLGVLWAPVGLRFHATHHLIPEMPYHSLGKAHKMLLEGLSKKNLYIQANSGGLWSTLARLWRESKNLVLFVGYF
jgi:fatty acid desaturase